VHAHLPQPHDPFTSLLPPQGVKLTPQHFAYLKISEGCNHSCTFCIIPSMRGPLVSRPIGDVLQEARTLAEVGRARTAGDLAGYQCLRCRPEVPHRLRRWAAAAHPAARTVRGAWPNSASGCGCTTFIPIPSVDALLPLMAEGRILPYLDVPFQHASARILKAMKRPASAENNLERLRTWRAVCPELTVRSTFITGFPRRERSRFCRTADVPRRGAARSRRLLSRIRRSTAPTANALAGRRCRKRFARSAGSG
jgi:ribosomal protein S12 methylthiotransferase